MRLGSPIQHLLKVFWEKNIHFMTVSHHHLGHNIKTLQTSLQWRELKDLFENLG